MDKVEKIREEVKNLKSQLLRGDCSSQVAMETSCKDEAYDEVLAILDTMQEEPVSNITGIKSKKAEGKLKECIESITEGSIAKARKQLEKEPVSEIDFEQELHKYFGQVKDFTLCVNIAKHFYDEGYFDGHIHDGDRIEDVDGRKVNVSRFRRVAKPLEAPVSEDLEKAAVEAFKQIVDENRNSFLEIFKAGAKWKAELLMAKAFDFTKEHNTACILASECLRGNGWFSKERDFNELFRHLSCVDKLFEGKFSGKTKVIVIKEE